MAATGRFASVTDREFFVSTAVKPAWMLGPVREPITPEISKRIDLLRILLMFLIVLNHGAKGVTVRIGDPGPLTTLMVSLFNDHIILVTVPLFFAISGFLFLRKFELSLAAYGEMLRKKFFSLFIPYVLFNIWIVAWFYFVGSIETMGSWNYFVQHGLWAKIFGVGGYATPVNYPLWFLRDLMLVFVLSPVLLLFLKEAPGVGLVTLFVLWTGLDHDPYSYHSYFFMFYLGGFVARSRLALSGRSWWQRWGALVFIVLTVVLVGQTSFGITDAVVQRFLFKCYLVIGVAFFWYVSSFPRVRDSAMLHRMARFSFFIYLAHEPTVSIFQTRLLSVWVPASDVQQTMFYFLTGVAVTFFLWGVGEVFSRFLPRVYAVATGARLPRRKPLPAVLAPQGH